MRAPGRGPAADVRLGPGQFYGLPQLRARGREFDMRLLAATTREDEVEVHTHSDAHFVLVLAGRYLSSAADAPDPGPLPLLIFNPPGTTHRDRFAGGVGTFATVSLDAAALATLELPTRAPARRLGATSALRVALSIARELWRHPDEAVLESLGWELLGSLVAAPGAAPPAWAARAYAAVMDGAVRAGLRVADVAREAGVHPVHLARGFRRAFGWSPGELLRWRRVDRAAELLRRPRPSIAEIAQLTGFVDQSHLTRAFRATLGCAPAAYRRAHVARIQDTDAAG